jgi:hypothetical protein
MITCASLGSFLTIQQTSCRHNRLHHAAVAGHRSQLLEFTETKTNTTHGVLCVTAPAGPNYAPPGHYLLFLQSGDVYSKAAWVQLRKPLGQVRL